MMASDPVENVPGTFDPKSDRHSWVSCSVEETQAIGETLGRALRAGDVLAFYGELGSGKTTMIQGLARGLGRAPETIKSPTFVLMREYPGEIPLVHLDGYRLAGAPSVAWLDVELLFAPEKITVIEWAERFEGLLPDDHLAIRLHHVSTNRRRLVWEPSGDRAHTIVEQLRQSKIQNPKSEISSVEEHDDATRD